MTERLAPIVALCESCHDVWQEADHETLFLTDGSTYEVCFRCRGKGSPNNIVFLWRIQPAHPVVGSKS